MDSLISLVSDSERDSNLINLYIEIGDEYEREFPDSALLYYLHALDLSQKLKNQKKEALSLLYIGVIHKSQGNYEKALEYYNKSIEIYLNLNDHKGQANCYSNIGNIHLLLGNSDKAVKQYMKSLVIYEDINDKLSIAKININIGNIYLYEEEYHEALNYFEKSLDTYNSLIENSDEDQMQIMYGISYCYGNMGVANLKIGDRISKINNDSARVYFDITMDYYNRSLEICIKMNDIHGMANCYTNIGVVNWKLQHYEESIVYYKNALEMRRKIGDKTGVAMVLGNISYGYITLADSISSSVEERTIYLKDAIEFGLESYELAVSINSTINKRNAAGYLKSAYKKLNMSNEALKYAEIYIVAQDSLNSMEKTKEITEIESKYQNEKQRLEIEKLENERILQNATIAKQEAENKKQRILIYSFIIGLVLIFVFSVLLYRLFLQKRKANEILAEQNSRIKSQKEEIETHRDEIKAQRDLAAEQRDLIIDQKKEITDSIHYAYRIQSAVIPDEDLLNSLLKDYFIFYKPRDIVSGDFYWVGEIDKKTIIIAADCTGHGVPGAFMSMLGVAFLNEIVNKERVSSPAEILNKLRGMIIRALKQHGNDGDQYDGMDIAALCLNTESYDLEFAGANNPLYIIRNNELLETKGDKMPVAFYYRMDDFKVNKYKLIKGDVLYIFTDGFADQFGGPKGKKYKYEMFKNLLIDNHNYKFVEQKNNLELEFDNWRGDFEQVDDVLVIGLTV